MRSGTPGFVASRLKEARDARGINTLISLADLLQVDTSTVSRWESGQSAPTPETLIELAAVLRVRPSYFLRAPFEHGPAPIFFRSLASARKQDQARQRARLRWVQDVSIVIQHYVNFPAVDVPDVLAGASYRQLRDEDLERIASDLRKHWKLGDRPITNVLDVLERAGFVIAADEMGTTALDGLCNWSAHDKRPYLLLATDKMSFFRRQMDAAHEMAHAILHRDVSEEGLKADFDIIEKQAFRLASAFLMPAQSFSLAVGASPTLSGLLSQKDRMRVSVKAMIRRCRDLELVSPDDERQLYKYYSGKGWTREEPLDRLVPVAKPRLLANAIGMIVEAGVRNKEDLLANEFTIPARDIEELLGLDHGWFSHVTGQVVQLRSTRNGRVSAPADGADVIVFRPRAGTAD